jgi:hypothetical protein
MSQMGQTRSFGDVGSSVRFARKRTRLDDFMSTHPNDLKVGRRRRSRHLAAFAAELRAAPARARRGALKFFQDDRRTPPRQRLDLAS